jgi:Skp family chaperone for outer membrane proteins
MPIGRPLRPLTPALALFAVLCVAMPRLGHAQDGAAQPAKVAVVNYNKVLFAYKRQEDLSKELSAFTEQLQKDLDKAREQLRKLENEAALLESRNPRRQELEERIIQKRAELAVQERMARLKQQDKMVVIRTDLYNDISTQVSAVARQQGYTLVLRIAKDDPTGEMGFGVMHYADAIDITDEVIERLNKNYATGR